MVRALSLVVVLLVACDASGGDASDGDAGDGPDADLGPPADAGAADATPGCPRTPSPDDGVRRVVIAHPFTAGGGQADVYRVLTLSADGKLGATGPTFSMGRAFMGEIAFTPDGEVGLVAQDDGTLGVFRLDAAGNPTVVHAGFAGSFYAARVVMDPSGERAWVVDTNWRENGGGVYAVRIACDGTLTDEGLRFAAKLPSALAFLPGGQAVLAATDAFDSAAGEDVHVVDLATPARVDSADGFTMVDAIVGGGAVVVNPSSAYFLAGDVSEDGMLDDRVIVARLEESGTFGQVETIFGIDDPIGLVASPFGDVVLVSSGYANAIVILAYNQAAPVPWDSFGEVVYVGSKPQLPGSAVVVQKGALKGLALFSENLGVRLVKMSGDLVVEDLGAVILGAGSDAIVGAIGVTP